MSKCMFYLNFFNAVRAQAKNTQTFQKFCVFFVVCIFFRIYSKVFAQAEVKHTIYVGRPYVSSARVIKAIWMTFFFLFQIWRFNKHCREGRGITPTSAVVETDTCLSTVGLLVWRQSRVSQSQGSYLSTVSTVEKSVSTVENSRLSWHCRHREVDNSTNSNRSIVACLWLENCVTLPSGMQQYIGNTIWFRISKKVLGSIGKK